MKIKTQNPLFQNQFESLFQFTKFHLFYLEGPYSEKKDEKTGLWLLDIFSLILILIIIYLCQYWNFSQSSNVTIIWIYNSQSELSAIVERIKLVVIANCLLKEGFTCSNLKTSPKLFVKIRFKSHVCRSVFNTLQPSRWFSL